MGKVLKFMDGLRNALTGQGTARDPRAASVYAPARPLTRDEIHAAYSGAGLIRKIVQIPALDMVREGRKWEMERDQIEALEKEETRHLLQQKLLQAEVLRGMGGGAFVLGLPGNPAEPAPAVGKGGLAYINVVSRWHLTFDELNDDATSAGYGEPVIWRLNAKFGQINVHPSRIIPFKADTSATLAAPSTYGAQDSYWGESTVQQVMDAVKDSDTARAAFAMLINKARLTRMGVPGLSELVATSDGEAEFGKRMQVMALAESLYNVALYDSGKGDGAPAEKIDDVIYNFAGAKDVINAYAEFVCAISDIPATRLLGRAPEGMNSSGDSQQKDWTKKVRSKQTLELKPCLDRLDVVLVPSALGSVPEKVDWDFEPLEAPDEDKAAVRFKTVAEGLKTIADLNAMPEQAFNEAAQNTLVEGEWMPGLGQALAKIPEAERFGIVPDVPSDPSLQGGGDLSVAGEDKVSGGAPTGDRPFDDARIYRRDRRGRFASSNGSKASISKFLTDAMAAPGEHASIDLGLASGNTPAHLHGYSRRIHSGTAAHAIKQHGDKAREAARGQLPVTLRDIARVPEIVSQAHTVKITGTGKQGRAQSVSYTARIGPREFTYVETVGSKRQQLVFKTMWKK